MKKTTMAKPMWVGAIALSMMMMPLALSTSAQTQTETAPGTAPTVDPAPTTTVAEEDDGFDWGLLGLLGLLGLAGLARKNNDDRTYYRDPNVDPSTTTRSDYR